VTDIRANEWRSYLGTADHAEYPSGSSSICYAYAEASRLMTGTDAANISYQRPAGSSAIEPGITPAVETTLSWSSWTDFAADCGMSRHWAGVHFKSSIQVSESYGTAIGRLAHEFMQRHIRGEV